MARFDVEVRVMPRPSLLDPQGQAVEHALTALGFSQTSDVRVGRAMTFHLESPDRKSAEKAAEAMCQRLLANPVTEDFVVSVKAA
jgi:phosphoribosylformylglycinamidine synthase